MTFIYTRSLGIVNFEGQTWDVIHVTVRTPRMLIAGGSLLYGRANSDEIEKFEPYMRDIPQELYPDLLQAAGELVHSQQTGQDLEEEPVQDRMVLQRAARRMWLHSHNEYEAAKLAYNEGVRAPETNDPFRPNWKELEKYQQHPEPVYE